MNSNIIIKTILKSFLDCLFAYISWIGSIFVFTYLFVLDYSLIDIINQKFWFIILSSIVFHFICGVYKSLWEHPGVGSIIRIATASALSSFSVYVFLRIEMGFWSNPGIGVMAFYFSLTFAVSHRIYKVMISTISAYLSRFFNVSKNIKEKPIKTLLIGAGDSASSFILNPSQQGRVPRNILGILDKDGGKHGYHLHGVNILGYDSEISKFVKKFDIEEIIITVPSIKNEDIRRIVKLLPAQKCRVRLLTGLSTDKASDKLRDINIADLLGRQEANLDIPAINGWLENKVILVTGGGGSIGSEICRQLLEYNIKKIIIFDISENNLYNLKEELKIKFGIEGNNKIEGQIGSVQDNTRLDEIFKKFKPNIVFHAAAYKHVPLMEDSPRLAYENNVLGTYRAAKLSILHNVERFVMISTDKAVNPTNIMGASKRMSEILTLGMNGKSTEFVCVRFGNVLDSNGSVIPLFKRQIEAGGPITVTHPDIIRYFMTIPEAAKLVLDAGAMANGGEIFILDMGEQIKIIDLAENLIRMAGLTPNLDIKIEFTGLRPGEKLYEELMINKDGILKTQNNKIFVAKPNTPEILPELLSSIESNNHIYFNNLDFKNFFKKYIPEYIPFEENAL